MPSIQDVADQINARLDLVVTHTDNTAQNTAANLAVSQDIRTQMILANARLAQIDNSVDTGFANVSQGLFAILEVNRTAVHLLDHHREQNDTIICELRNTNELLCNIVRKFGQLLRLQEESLQSVKRIEGITERVHCCEAADYDRTLKLHQKIEECCPPAPVPEEACPEQCRTPDFRPRQPGGQDWRPLDTPRPNPEG